MAKKLMVSIRESHAINRFTKKRRQPWYWVLINTDNNKIMATSSERYTNYADCEDAARLVNGDTVDVYLRTSQPTNQPTVLLRTSHQ